MFVSGFVYPLVVRAFKQIKAITHPVTFPYKHVLITGCGTGLGKAIVQEIYQKGAYITMIGRDKDKLLSVAQSVDVILLFTLNFRIKLPFRSTIRCLHLLAA